MRRKVVERARLREERIDAPGVETFEVVATFRRPIEYIGQLSTDLGGATGIDEALHEREAVLSDRSDDVINVGLNRAHAH